MQRFIGIILGVLAIWARATGIMDALTADTISPKWPARDPHRAASWRSSTPGSSGSTWSGASTNRQNEIQAEVQKQLAEAAGQADPRS